MIFASKVLPTGSCEEIELSVDPGITVPEVIGHDEDDVGFVCRLRSYGDERCAQCDSIFDNKFTIHSSFPFVVAEKIRPMRSNAHQAGGFSHAHYECQ